VRVGQPLVARHLLPLLGPLTAMCTETWDSATAITRVRAPTLVIVGTHDTLVPPHMSERLFQARPRQQQRPCEGAFAH
jgi:fermentation-respiration switch protein FrsA (DUF1100 family)